MNNSYGFGATRKNAEKLGLPSCPSSASSPKERTFCVESEFTNRNDGFEPMLKHYGVPLGSGVNRNNVRTLDTGAVYAATDQRDCLFGEIFTTDGRIKSLDLVVLEDDKHFFPAYNVCPGDREEGARQVPAARGPPGSGLRQAHRRGPDRAQRPGRRRRPGARRRRHEWLKERLRRVDAAHGPLPAAVTEPWRIRGSWVGTL